MKISTILDQIDGGSIALPEFQRGYVWNRDQVRSLMLSLYHKHPVGSLLVWVTKTENANARGDNTLPPGSVKLLLDGQQRITSLYGIIRGKSPKFFDGNPRTFTGLYFNLEEEIYEFYMAMKMKENPAWINVTELMQKGVGDFIQQLLTIPELQSNLNLYINRLNNIENIKNIDLHIEEVTGEEKTVDIVVDIFNQVNSGGTKLSKGDLALAKICATWPEARQEMKNRLEKWNNAGFHFRLELLLRCINTILTGEAYYSAMKDVDTETFQKGLNQAENSIDKILNLISARLGLDHDRVLGSKYSFPLITRYLNQYGSHLDSKERDKLLYWYIHTFLWGRYAGSTESVINKDLHLIEEIEGGLDRLVDQLRQNRGDLRLNANDFQGWSRSARFYPLLYMMTRVCHAKDWDTGIELSNHLLGHLSRLEVHHIFPKSMLYDYGYTRPQVNAIANFTFLTQETNLLVSNRNPEEYLEEFVSKQPDTVESHWIPMDRNLWKVENYLDFLEARRELLAKSANEFLDSLLEGEVPDMQVTSSILDRKEVMVPDGIESEEEEQIIRECNEWVVKHDLPEGEYLYELIDPETGKSLAILDLAWPNGLQEGYSHPVALLIEEDLKVKEIVNRFGYLYFTNLNDFYKYVQHEILSLQSTNA